MDTDSKDIKYRDVVHKVYEQANVCDVVKGFQYAKKKKRKPFNSYISRFSALKYSRINSI